jgi:hypothetical protein
MTSVPDGMLLGTCDFCSPYTPRRIDACRRCGLSQLTLLFGFESGYPAPNIQPVERSIVVMHVLVNDVQAYWQHIDSLDLAGQFGISRPAPPRVEPWGLTVAYVTDPAGVLWHFAEATKPKGNGT